ncbi:MAG: pyruvate kinase [Fimbriimonadales bacterium]
MFRKTKIVCTLGPAVDSVQGIDALVGAGMNVARINCSHGDWVTRSRWIDWVREISTKRQAHVAILLDLQGPKFRLGTIRGKEMLVAPGQLVAVGSGPGMLPIPQPEVLRVLEPGRKLLTGDGDVSFRVASREGDEITLTCLSGGTIRTKQGITVVGVSFDTPAMTTKDREDLRIGAEKGVEYVAISYVKSAADVRLVAESTNKADSGLRVIAKIEMRDAVQDIEDIIAVSDAIMVARGDLGLQMAIEDVPLVQKRIIGLCRAAGKPVITATQMMESMIHNPRPTRAEATDIANAILDGTDAIMLSGETAAGAHPIEAVDYMDKIAVKTEQSSIFAKAIAAQEPERISESTEAVAHAAVTIATNLRTKNILTFSTSGFTARMVSKYKPRAIILCATYSERTARQTSLFWGVRPLLTKAFGATEEMIATGFSAALEAGFLKTGDMVVVTAGLPVGMPGATNFVTLLRVNQLEEK